MQKLGGLALLLTVAACSSSPRTSPREPWNVLLVSVDTLRADHVSAYRQSERARTPNLDRIAEEGILFETVQTVAPTTLPSHASLFTGLSPERHGVRDNVGFYLSPHHVTLASRLGAAGYRTGAFLGAFVLDSRFGIDEGFTTYFDDFEEEEADIAGGLVTQRPGREVLDRALAWLDAGKQEPEPFFAFVHFYDPHAPYEAPDRGSSEDSESMPEDRYRDEVHYVDGLVGELLDWLDGNGEASRTVVVLTSDHGESLGEHGESTHGYFVYQSTLAVPWLLRFPDGPRGLRLSGLTSLVDVTPTLLDLLGLPELENTDGRSLVPLWEDGTSLRETAYSESFLPRVHFGWSELRSLRDERYKLILAPRPELYDLVADPDEAQNIAPREPDRVRSMTEALLERVEAEAASETALDAESRERLRSLGYLGGTSASSGSAGLDGEGLADPKDRIELYEMLIDTSLSDVPPSDGSRVREALSQLERAIETDPSVPRVHLLYGELLLKSGDTAAAQNAFERLVELDEGSFDGHYGLGVAHAQAGELDAASEAFARARSLEPRNTKSYFQLAELSMRRGDWASAERWLRQALELNPDRVLTERLAQVLLEASKPDEARGLLLDMVERHPDDPVAAYNLGQLLLVQGDAAGALVQFRRSSELATAPDPDVFQGIGNALVSLGRLDEAVGAYERATAIAPCFTQALSNLGSVHVQGKRFEEAKPPLQKAIDCDPTYERAYQNLAAVHLEQGALDEAIAVLRAGVRANPQSEELSATLEQLERYRNR